MKCYFNERLFDNDIVVVQSLTAKCRCGLNILYVLILSYSFFADRFTFSATLLYFSIRYNLSILVNLLGAT